MRGAPPQGKKNPDPARHFRSLMRSNTEVWPSLSGHSKWARYQMFGFRDWSRFLDSLVEIHEEAYRPEGIFGEGLAMMTADPTHPALREQQPNMQQMAYLVLPDEEIELGFVRPLRRSYQHVVCGTVTKIGLAIAATFARQPSFYAYMYCVHCKRHFPLTTTDDDGMIEYQFHWEDGAPVGQ